MNFEGEKMIEDRLLVTENELRKTSKNSEKMAKN